MSLATPSFAPARSAMLRRRIATYFTGGLDTVADLVRTLEQQHHAVHELSVDIRDGVRESGMACTVLLPGEQVEALLESLRELPAVVSAELA